MILFSMLKDEAVASSFFQVWRVVIGFLYAKYF